MTSFKVWAIIPVRKNSKRLPGKNIKDFHGKPLVCWTIESALNSKYISKVTVSTDDENILALKEKYPGVEFIERPEFLAQDQTASIEPVVHAMALQKEIYDYALLLQATSPLRSAAHIDKAIALAKEKKTDRLVSVKKLTDNLGHIVTEKNGATGLLSIQLPGTNLQVLNGAIYLTKWNELLSSRSFFDAATYFYEMDVLSSVDIDTPEDWMIASKNFEELMKEQS
jgi:CMP-N,N'-diacetyllegionaminic acid synthase